jgi:uncharacterized protein with PIN domain
MQTEKQKEEPLHFACDAMLGGLARWLRAAGYDASWRADVKDWDLVRQAIREKSVLLSSDGHFSDWNRSRWRSASTVDTHRSENDRRRLSLFY